MHPIYKPKVNLVLRTVLKPFARLIPQEYHFPVTGIIRVNLPEGKRIALACNPTSYQAKVLFWEGYRGFEYDLVKIFIEVVKQASVFLDVGANIGYYSLLASAFNPKLEIVSFEPLPAAYRYLRTNLYNNHFINVTPQRMALSDEKGTAQFFVSKNLKFLDIDDHLTSTGSLDEDQATRTNVTESFEVKTETLDAYVERYLWDKVDIIKLDTEASEHFVLRGAENVLTKHRPIVFCEVLPGKIEQDLEVIFRKHGYQMFRAEAGRLVPVDHLVHSKATSNDHVMVHPDALHKLESFIG